MKFGRLRFVLILALLASNLLVGILGLHFIQSSEERYAGLFDQSVPVINNLRTLTRELGTVQRLARRISDPQREPEWDALLAEMEERAMGARQRAHEIGEREILKNNPVVAAMRQADRLYAEQVDEFLALARANRLADAHRHNSDMLRPTYDRYMDALDAVADYAEREVSQLREHYATKSRWFGGFLLAISGWPLLAAGVLAIGLGLFVTLLLAAVFFPRLFASKRAAT